jgi:long-chain fatty acid transport protein
MNKNRCSGFIFERLRTLLIAALLTSLPGMVHAQGVFIPSAGTVNRSMGGTATAAPIDGMGALLWNSAGIGELSSSELGFGLDLVLVDANLTSITGLGAGSTGAEPGVTPIPNIGWVHHTSDPDITIGLGLFGVAGFKTNYPSSSTNPILTPQSNTPGFPGGFGRINSEAQFLQLVPAVSMRLTERLSFGFGPTVTLGSIMADPFVFTAPDDADGSGAPRYPIGSGTRVHFGGGFQLGMLYKTRNDWNLGASFRSRQWMETFRFKTQDETGLPRTSYFEIDLPNIVSVGAAYTGFERLLWAVDLRYFDYGNTSGFGDEGFNPDGSLRGLGWSSVFAVSTGLQYKVNDVLTVRSGYSFNENPIHADDAGVNVATPLIQQHIVSVGSSLALGRNVSLNSAYSWLVPSEKTGPIVTPFGAIPGSSVTNQISAHILSFGITTTY